MNLYRGHWFLAFAITFFVVAVVTGFAYKPEEDTLGNLIMILSCLPAVVFSMISLALAERLWVPKWERDEKRTGRQPGDE